MTGKVKIGGQVIDKSGKQINRDKFYESFDKTPDYIEVDTESNKYVSRGAYKLEAAYEEFELDFKGATVFDIGSSTGGFTDFALQHEANKVLALDVGKAQLHDKLRKDSRVVSIEEYNVRDLSKEDLLKWLGEGYKIDYAVADLSFISVLKVLPVLKKVLEEADISKSKFIFLIKPQFEASKEIVDRCRGVIKDEKLREEIFGRIKNQIIEMGFNLISETLSPIKGAKGNQEYLLYFDFK